MEHLTNAESALLGLLSEQDMYPYQIEKEVQERDMRYWTELSMSSIYKVLKRLENEGFVESEVEISEDNRTRKVYSLTMSGKNSLNRQVAHLLSEPEHVRWRMDIGISNLDNLSREKALECLHTYRDELIKKRDGYKNLENFLKIAGCPDYRMALARRPYHILSGELKWLDEYISELSGGRAE